nr:ABC transporter substrate-binding protein [uncultured Sulfitobacter sp.]
MIRALCFAGALFCAPAHTIAKPARVVSINLCTDQLAMLVAAPDQLISVSRIASDPRSSAMVAQAAAYRTNSGLAEEIYLMRPDLVVAGQYTSSSTIAMLERLGIETVKFDLTYDLADVSTQLRRMGDVLGQSARAAALVSKYEADLSAFQKDAEAQPRAALYYANGYTSGDKTLAGQILMRAGLDNIAAEHGLESGGMLPLEVLALAQPDTVITSLPYAGGSRAEDVMDHPVVAQLKRTRLEGSLTDHDWVCGTPFVLRAVGDMVALRNEIHKAEP